jgi:hypothetical protein
MTTHELLKKDKTVKIYEESNISLSSFHRQSNINTIIKQLERDISMKIKSSKAIVIALL